MKTDKIKEVLENMWRNTGPGGDLNIADDEEIIDQAAHQLNQMLREEYRRGGYFELAKLKSHKIVSPDGVFNKAEQHKRLSKLAKEAGSTESGLNQMLIEAKRDLLQRIVINTNIYLENSDITAEQLRDKLKEELETLSVALKAEKDKWWQVWMS